MTHSSKPYVIINSIDVQNVESLLRSYSNETSPFNLIAAGWSSIIKCCFNGVKKIPVTIWAEFVSTSCLNGFRVTYSKQF